MVIAIAAVETLIAKNLSGKDKPKVFNIGTPPLSHLRIRMREMIATEINIFLQRKGFLDNNGFMYK